MQIDEKIIIKFIAGDIEALKTIYETTKQAIYTVIYKIAGNHYDAEDSLHDVYVRIYEKRALYNKEKAAFYTWLYSVAVNCALNNLKKKKPWNDDLVLEDKGMDILEKIAKKDEQEQALKILEKVTPNFRICLLLRDVEEKTYEEIAKILDVAVGTVKSRISRGRTELRELFLQYERRFLK